jgi:hypothetical protein
VLVDIDSVAFTLHSSTRVRVCYLLKEALLIAAHGLSKYMYFMLLIISSHNPLIIPKVLKQDDDILLIIIGIWRNGLRRRLVDVERETKL